MFSEPIALSRIPKAAALAVPMTGFASSKLAFNPAARNLTGKFTAGKDDAGKCTAGFSTGKWSGNFRQCDRLPQAIANTMPFIADAENLDECSIHGSARNVDAVRRETSLKKSAAVGPVIRSCSITIGPGSNTEVDRPQFLLLNPIAYFKKKKT